MAQAMEYSGITEKSKLVAHALKELVRREVTDRFLALEGTMPDLEYPGRGPRVGREPIQSSMLNDSDD